MMINELNNRGQLGLVRVAILLVIFVIVWAVWLGKFIAEWVADFLSKNYVTGIEAFLWANLNLWIFIFVIIAVMLLVYSGGGQA